MTLNQSKINFLIFTLLVIIGLMSCKEKKDEISNVNEVEEYVKTESGLKYKVLREGNGIKARNGDFVLLFETTSYRNGTELYSNENSGNPIKVQLGANQVTKGVEEGLTGMRSDEIRQLIVPNYLAKREVYPDNVSPDSTLLIKLIAEKVIRTE
ncbi:MAG: FKBP-type peptidyl-prolyl cis-trans isomerase [Bacteroidota bacterium]